MHDCLVNLLDEECTAHIAVAPDGATIASSAWNNSVKLWRASDGILL